MSKNLDEIVFEHRNKEYGAYDLRKSYRSLLTWSFFSGTSIFLVVIAVAFVYLRITSNKKQERHVDVVLQDIVDLPPPIEEKDIPPPSPPPPPPKKEIPKQEIVRDMIPDPKPTPKVEEPPKTMEEVKETTIGTIDQEGEKVDSYSPPVEENVGFSDVGDEIFDGELDQSAEFPGGINKFRQRFTNNFDSSVMDGDEGTITTLVTFVVEKDGTITDIKAVGPNALFNREAERTVKSIKTKWTPGKKRQQNARSIFKLPVKMNFNF